LPTELADGLRLEGVSQLRFAPNTWFLRFKPTFYGSELGYPITTCNTITSSMRKVKRENIDISYV